MKLLTEYLERAVQLEKLAASEPVSAFKSQLLQQAGAYRKLAARRAREYGLPPPSPPETLSVEDQKDFARFQRLPSC
ncbi:hypothetical protein IVB15_10870 [Bradyrhizobium sp. 182]|uniref:hypothetical protein n=1 Tax=unclassified Bradyrhizobium TaxID=2631580 RepID=UPI001FF8F6E5|nr:MULTISPECIES: hypothetical protein [unclassified Bradyrhizobium]MCK1421345.1 hypothetical protein [Bradyrhizobium sp. CW12]MCK1528223.1 hypothetical protein [Bradyrhizobium sp. 182]MCK1643449.1 hypothetical protein [Bradyrhizobium sp. 154]